MKTLQSLLYAFIAMFVLAGCNDDGDFLTGSPENPDCYYVYFPFTGESTDLELDPSADTKVTLKVRRLKSEDAITVPVTIKSNVAGIFEASEIKFANGQDETTLDVTFPNSEIGTTYSCEISIEDPQYASIYGEKPAGTKFSVTRVKWNLLTGPKGETTGKWRDDLGTAYFAGNLRGTPNAEKDVEIYERADKEGYYRIKDIYDDDFLFGTLLGVRYSNVHSVPTYTIIDATDKAKVWFPVQKAGYSLDDLGEEFVIVSLCKENYPDMESATKYGTLKDGILTFPSESILLSLPSKWEATSYYVANSSMTRLMLPGIKAYDYSLAITNSEPVDGVVKLGFKFGGDVAKVQYAFFSGAFTDAVAESKSKEIDEGAIPSKNITESGTVDAVLDETGIYSVVGNIYDKDGALQGCQYKSFGYVKAGDEKPVLLSLGLNITNKYAGQGFTSEDSAEFWANGKDIVSGSYGIFETDALTGKTEAELKALVTGKDAKKFSEKDLEAINASNGSFSVMLGGLNGGTEYTVVVLAYNDYVSKIITADAVTDGTPHPLKRQYTSNDLLEKQPSKAEYCKTWNYYAVNKNATDGSTKRIRIGTVTISEVAQDATKVLVSGISGIKPSAIGGSDAMLFLYEDGLLGSLSDQIIGSYQNMPVSYWMTDTKFGGYSANYALLGGLVEDGYIAFVANPGYFAQNITFSGFRFIAFSDETLETAQVGLTWLYNLMLVDPAKDDTATTTSSVMAIEEAMAEPSNFVELRGLERMRAYMDGYADKKSTTNPIDAATSVLVIERSDAKTVDARVSFTPGMPNVRPVSAPEVKRLIK